MIILVQPITLTITNIILMLIKSFEKSRIPLNKNVNMFNIYKNRFNSYNYLQHTTMLLKLRLFNRMFQSGRKFYQILASQQSQYASPPQFPEQAILSKHIKQHQKKQSDQQGLTLGKWKSQKQSNQNKSYQQLLNTSPYGSVKAFQYKNHNLTLISTNYYRVNDSKLHKLMYSHKPDAIIVQRRPQYHIHQFQLLKKGKDQIFSDRAYLEQLKASPNQLKLQDSGTKSRRPLINALNKNKDDILEKHVQKQILQQSGFEMCRSYVSSYMGTDLYLSEMPSRSYRQWIANKNTLMELQQIFKNIARRLPRYKNLKFNPYQLGTLMYPDTFLKINDHYMATVLQMLIALKKYKNIVGVFGIMQNQAVMSLLKNRQALQRPIIELLIAPRPRGTIIRNIEALQIIQKHILLDVLFYGDQLEDVQKKYLHVTNSIIEMYGKQIDRQTIMRFQYDKSLEYINLLRQKYQQGQAEIKKQFVRQTLRSKS